MADEKARATSFEDAFNKKALTHGRILINQLAILVKVAQMHDLKNVAVEKAAENLMGALRVFFEDQKSFAVYLVGDYLFIEDIRIKYNIEDFNNFDFLVNEFKKRKLGALSFNSVVSAAELITFASVFLKSELGSEDVYQDFARKLGASGVSGLGTDELKPPKASDDFEKVLDIVKAARRSYVRVVLRLKELLEGIERGAPADIRKLKRAVQSMVDSVYKSEAALLRLASIRRKEDMLPRHYANVCLLSLGIGKRLGLSKYQMARLGMAAALHDIGRQGLPEDLFEGDREMDDEALRLINSHPRMGVQTLLRLKGLNEVAVSAMIVAYEHHRNIDGSGYPEVVENKEMSLFSRIVRIADNFDAATSSGIYGRVPFPPEKALSVMLGRSGEYYDKELLSHFVKMTGAYPVGTLLLLSDYSIGVVTAAGAGREGFNRPRVALVRMQDSGMTNAEEVVDLTDKDEGGNYRRSVLRALDPHQYRVNIYRYLI